MLMESMANISVIICSYNIVSYPGCSVDTILTDCFNYYSTLIIFIQIIKIEKGE